MTGMTDADIHRSKPGFRYSVASAHSGPGIPIPDKPGWFRPGPADYYFITKGNTLKDELGEHFATAEEADARAKELNDADAIKSLRVPKTHRARFDRYRALHGEHLHWSYYGREKHPLTCLPRKPGKYAVACWGDSDLYWSHFESLDEVREELLSGDAYRVVDLDTGEDVPFTLSAAIGDEVVAS